MGPGAPEKLGAPGPTWNLSFSALEADAAMRYRNLRLTLTLTLALYSYDFWKCKSRKNWKRSIFFKLSWQQRIFGTEINGNEIQNCKSLEQNSFFLGFAAVNKSIMSVKSILWTMSCSMFRRAKLYIFSCAMEERKTDLIFLIVAEDSFSSDSGIL